MTEWLLSKGSALYGALVTPSSQAIHSYTHAHTQNLDGLVMKYKVFSTEVYPLFLLNAFITQLISYNIIALDCAPKRISSSTLT